MALPSNINSGKERKRIPRQTTRISCAKYMKKQARQIKIIAGKVEAIAELNDSAMADAIWNALPLQARGSTWGDEIYFSIPVDKAKGPVKEVVDLGELGFWPPGKAFCIFYGQTPISRAGEIRPADPVVVFGKIIGDPKVFKPVTSGTSVSVERMEN